MAEAERDAAELTPDQKKILNEVYLYSDTAEYTEAELDIAARMFDTPEKFALLRRILQVFTPAERGLTMKTPQAFIEADPADHARYAFETAVDIRADEKVRHALVAFYRTVRAHIQQGMKDDFVKQNQEEFEEGKRTEEYQERQEADSRIVGPNV